MLSDRFIVNVELVLSVGNILDSGTGWFVGDKLSRGLGLFDGEELGRKLKSHSNGIHLVMDHIGHADNHLLSQ